VRGWCIWPCKTAKRFEKDRRYHCSGIAFTGMIVRVENNPEDFISLMSYKLRTFLRSLFAFHTVSKKMSEIRNIFAIFEFLILT